MSLHSQDNDTYTQGHEGHYRWESLVSGCHRQTPSPWEGCRNYNPSQHWKDYEAEGTL